MHFEIPCSTNYYHGVGTSDRRNVVSPVWAVVEAAVRETGCLGNVTIYQDLGQRL
jgi:hypothetical protein